MAALNWGNGIKKVENPNGNTSYTTDISLTGDTFYDNYKGEFDNGLAYSIIPNISNPSKASLVFDSDPSSYLKDGSLDFNMNNAEIFDSGELPSGITQKLTPNGWVSSNPVPTAPTAPIVKQYDLALSKPLEPIKPDDETSIEYQNYLEQDAQYKNDLASYYANSNQPDAIKYRKDALAKQYGYAKNADGTSIFSDGELTQLANGSNTDNTAAQAKIDTWATNELSKYDTSNALAGSKDVFLADLKSGKAFQPDYVMPFKVQPKPVETPPNLADGTSGGILNQQTGTIDKPADVKPTDITYDATTQGTAAKDGISTAGTGATTQVKYDTVDTNKLSKVGETYIKAPTTINATGTTVDDVGAIDRIGTTVDNAEKIDKTGTTVADPNEIKVVDLKDRVAHTDAATIDKTGTTVDVNDPRISAASNVNAVVDGTHAQNIAVAPDSLVSNRLAGLLGANNPYIQQARNAATVQSARRGLLNSGAAAGFAQDAAIKAALPIAQSDAQTLYDAQKTNATAANTLLNTGVQLKAGALNNDATAYAGVVKSNADANTKINTQNAQFIQDANFNNAGFNNTQSNSYEGALRAAATQDVANKITVGTTNATTTAGINTQDTANNLNRLLKNAGVTATLNTQDIENALNIGTTNANNNLARATDNAKLTINENQYAATLGLDASKFNIAELDKFKQLNATITNAEAESNAGYSRTVETAAALAKNDIWKNVVQNTYDSLKTNAGAANTLNNLFTTGNITLANALASHLWTMAESEDAAKKKEIENTLLHSFDMEKVVLTGNQAWDLANLNNQAQILTSKMGYDASLIKDITTQSMASTAAISTKEGMTEAGKATSINNINAVGAAGAASGLNLNYSIPMTATSEQQQTLANTYNLLKATDPATLDKVNKLLTKK
jgi:hypothetical protein